MGLHRPGRDLHLGQVGSLEYHAARLLTSWLGISSTGSGSKGMLLASSFSQGVTCMTGFVRSHLIRQ